MADQPSDEPVRRSRELRWARLALPTPTACCMIIDGIGLAACTGVNRSRCNAPARLSSMRGSFIAVLSFTLVLALQYTTGPIKIKFSTVDFEGASGPIIFWCVCFFVISYGLYMMGLADVVKVAAPGDPRSVLQLFQKQ